MKYADILINTRSQEIGHFFTYGVPEELQKELQAGQLVAIPFRNKTLQGIIGRVHDEKPAFKTRNIEALLDPTPVVDPIHMKLAEFISDTYLSPLAASTLLMVPMSGFLNGFKTATYLELAGKKDAVQKVGTKSPAKLRIVECLQNQSEPIAKSELLEEADVSEAPLRELIRANIVRVTHHIVWRTPKIPESIAFEEPLDLNEAQQKAVSAILKSKNSKVLLHGVTGSGKTEVYLQVAQRVLDQGKSVIILVPEISLTPQTMERFGNRFGNLVVTLHSRMSSGEKFDAWQQIRSGVKRVVIGPRSALFAPVKDLGLIVLDEEHDASFKQENVPHYDARAVAEELADLAGARLIMGSATPSFENYYRAKNGGLELVELPKPIHATVEPKLFIVDMKQELKKGSNSIFSDLLVLALKKTLSNGKQGLLFLNRRGNATTVVCRECGYVAKCKNCHTPLVYHQDLHSEYLQCHHCNLTSKPPSTCPECSSTKIKYLGAGTEKVEAEAAKYFPRAQIMRMDKDTTRTKDAYITMYEALVNREADIIVGTQMIAKGWDLPHLDLVGIVLADPGLYWPDFRTNERNFQLLAQVVGRTGRRDRPGLVILQTYNPENEVLHFAIKKDYKKFYEHEIGFRQDLKYPPFSRLIKLTLEDATEKTVFDSTEKFALDLRTRYPKLLIDYGPSFFSRVRGRFKYQIIIRSEFIPGELLDELRELKLPWRVEVDPVSVL